MQCPINMCPYPGPVYHNVWYRLKQAPPPSVSDYCLSHKVGQPYYLQYFLCMYAQRNF